MIKNLFCRSFLSACLALSLHSSFAEQNHIAAPYTSTKKTLAQVSPTQALQQLKAGNLRFVNNKPIVRNYLQQAKTTSMHGQFPFAVILSCMDSRSPVELILDQGIGDIFSIRVAGNIIDEDQLGSMEYGTKVIGAKLIVVMGHTQCGAVSGACQNVQMGNLTALLNKIQPSVQKIKDASKENTFNCKDSNTIDKIAQQNVLTMLKQIQEQSPIIRDLADKKQILLVGAMQNLHTGAVSFFDETGATL